MQLWQDGRSKTSAGNIHLAVLDQRRGLREGQEHERLLAYYPDSVPVNSQVTTAGLLFGVVQLTSLFNADGQCVSLNTDQTRWAAVCCEPWLWLLMVVPRAWQPAEAASDGMLQQLLRRLYGQLCLLHGKLQALLDSDPTAGLARQQLWTSLPHLCALLCRAGTATGPRLPQLLSPLSAAQGLPFLQPSQKTALSVQCLADSLLLSSHGGRQPVQGVLIGYQAHLLWAAGLGRDDTLRLADLLSMLHGAKGKATAITHTLPGSSPERNLERVWLQDGTERLRLVTHRHGPLLLALLLMASDTPPAAEPGNADPSATNGSSSGVSGSGVSSVGSSVSVLAESLVEGCYHMVESVAELLAEEMPVIGNWHVKGYRYLVCDELPLSSVATPSAKVFGATSHDAAALLAAVRREQERVVATHLRQTAAAAALCSTAAAGGDGDDSGSDVCGTALAAPSACVEEAARSAGVSLGTGEADNVAAAGAEVHVPGNELLVEGSGGGWVGALRRDSRSMYVASVQRGDSLHGAGALIGRLFESAAAGGSSASGDRSGGGG